MVNSRKPSCKKTTCQVMINHPEHGQVVGCMREMSEEEVVIEVNPAVRFVCGQILGVHIIGISDANRDPLLTMQVMQAELSGIVLKFVEISEKSTTSCSLDQYVNGEAMEVNKGNGQAAGGDNQIAVTAVH